MNEFTRLAAITLLQNEIIVASWGIKNIVIEDKFLRFDVDGLKYQGKVTIQAKENGEYALFFGQKLVTCRINSIVNTLDYLIERTDNYTDDLEQILNLRWKH